MSEDGAERGVAIVLGHGDLASGLVSAVHQITGCGSRFIALSNTGLATPEIETLLRERLEATGARVIFTDLPAGSCNFAACRLLRELPDLIVVTGVSLPVLLHYATHAELPPAEAAAQAAARGAASLKVLSGTPREH
ncbi:MAG TPA: hypothetical protein VFS44_04345 [Gemmatimonadaceae bacterium]|nr:hypothetical protein [Gemmatimonadaceae bacterium]